MAYCTIDDPTLHMNITLWTGNNAARSITGLNHAPAMLIIKSRSNSSSWYMFDKNRGTNKISPDDNTVDSDQSGEAFTSLDADGMTFNDSGGGGGINSNALTYCGWSWKGGTTSGITTNGSTNVTPSSYSFDQTGKFASLKYSGNGNTDNQVAHGLGSKPDFMLVKNITGSINSWAVFHKSPGNEKYFELDVANAMADGINRWQDTDPDTVNFTTGNSDTVNNSSYDYACQAWSEVQGYSKFGTYTGQAGTGTSGPFVYTGFRPSIVLIKNQASGSWFLFDSKRASASNIPEGTTGVPSYLEPNTTGNEQGDNPIFLFANGFQCLDSLTNASGATYIYASWAEQPLVNSSGVPNNAR